MPTAYYTIPANLLFATVSFIGFQPSLPGLFSANAETLMHNGKPGVDYRRLAYFYTTLSFLAQIIRSQTELQHLYYARRADVRVQCELIGSIYEKSLVRRDITGAIASDAKAMAASKDGDTKAKIEADNAKDAAVASADVGKIVSLIATDASQCSSATTSLTVSGHYRFLFSSSAALIRARARYPAPLRNPSLLDRFWIPPLLAHGLDGVCGVLGGHHRHAFQLAPYVDPVEIANDAIGCQRQAHEGDEPSHPGHQGWLS